MDKKLNDNFLNDQKNRKFLVSRNFTSVVDTGLPFNFEYRKGTYTKFKMTVAENADTDISVFMVGVSLPFVL